MDVMSFKGYQGTVETSLADGVLHGKVLFINDLVTYEAHTLSQLKQEFEAAVEDYLHTCQEVGKPPNKPCSGQFNVRISPELHKRALMRALAQASPLNTVVVQALEALLSEPKPSATVNHIYHVTLHQPERIMSTAGEGLHFFETQNSYGAKTSNTH